MHNGISRLYETFGNGGADTEKRILDAGGILAHLVPPESAAADRRRGRSATTTTTKRPRCSPPSPTSRSTRITSSRTTTSRASAPSRSPRSKAPRPTSSPPTPPRPTARSSCSRCSSASTSKCSSSLQPPPARSPGDKRGDKPKPETFPAGSIVVRMDQPYSRIADALLDRQYWAPDDPQKHPYDDTGWSFSELFNVKVVRVTDAAILKAAMTPLDDPASLTGKLAGIGLARRRRQHRPDLAALACLQAQGRKHPSPPTSHSTPTATTSPPARCSSPELPTTPRPLRSHDLALERGASRRSAFRRRAHRHRAAHRLHAHLARHAD